MHQNKQARAGCISLSNIKQLGPVGNELASMQFSGELPSNKQPSNKQTCKIKPSPKKPSPKKPSTKKQGGFTLLEVLVALAIAAVGLGAVTKSLYQSIHVADILSQKMIGGWVASNALAEIHISRQFQAGSGAGGGEEMAGLQWNVSTEYESTGNNEISQINISVYSEADPDREAANLFGFVTRPKN